jgi:hypothetical protein
MVIPLDLKREGDALMGVRLTRIESEIEKEVADRRAAVAQAPAQFEALKSSELIQHS